MGVTAVSRGNGGSPTFYLLLKVRRIFCSKALVTRMKESACHARMKSVIARFLGEHRSCIDARFRSFPTRSHPGRGHGNSRTLDRYQIESQSVQLYRQTFFQYSLCSSSPSLSFRATALNTNASVFDFLYLSGELYAIGISIAATQLSS